MQDMPPIRIGNNLDVLRGMDRGTVDCIYLDPPFNSGEDYNVTVEESMAQERAYTDTWTWTRKAQEDYDEFCRNPPNALAQTRIVPLLRTWHQVHSAVGGGLGTIAYLTMMAPRLVALYEVLKDTGALWLHCDPTASHYIKTMLDAVFGERYFRGEVIWQRTFNHGNAKKPAPVHDTILFYTKSDEYTWNPVYSPYKKEYIENAEYENGRPWIPVLLTASGVRNGASGKPWRHINPTDGGRHWSISESLATEYESRTAKPLTGTTQERLDAAEAVGLIDWPKKEGGVPMYKHFLDTAKGIPFRDIIIDIPPVSSRSKEWIDFDGQKPCALLERLIRSTSNEGDLVLDPFLGSGTTLMVAHRLRRRCVGIEMTETTAFVAKKRFIEEYGEDAYNGMTDEDHFFLPKDVPMDLEQARILAKENPKKLERWMVDGLGADPSWKKGADGGIDGHLLLKAFPGNTTRRMIVQVTVGKNLNHFQAFCWKVVSGLADKSEGLVGGIYCTFEENITPGMRNDAAAAGKFKPGFGDDDPEFPVIQFITIEDRFKHGFKMEGRVPGLVKVPDYSETKEARERRQRELTREAENLPQD